MVELPGPPQGKGRPRFSSAHGFVRAYTPARTRDYETALRNQALVVMGPRRPLSGPLSVSIEAWMPIPASWSRRQFDRAVAGATLPASKPDSDNILKIIGDGCNGIVWHDDRQLTTVVIRKRYGPKPGLVITVVPENVDGRLFDQPAANDLEAEPRLARNRQYGDRPGCA